MRCLASLSEPIADRFRRTLLVTAPGVADSPAHGPGVLVFDEDGNPESISPGAEHWIGQADGPRPRLVAAHRPGPSQVDLRHDGVRSRSELVGQIFLEHYVPRWEDLADSPAGWFAKASPIPAGSHPDLSPAPDPARRSG